MSTTTIAAQTSAAIPPPVIIQQNDPRRLVDYLMGELRTLSTEARKKHNHIKEAAESGLVRLRNISSSAASPDALLQSLRDGCAEIVHPFLLGCSSKQPRLVQTSLQSIQMMLQFCAIDRNAVPGIVNELWQLTEADCEELKVLQTITPFVSAEMLVTDWALSKCIVLVFRLNLSKDSSVINAASASVRQLFSCVFERVIQEDGMRANPELHILPQHHSPRTQQQQQCLAPPTLRPAAADAFLLLRDLCALIRREQPSWLVGLTRIAPILALELLESVLKNYPGIFFKHTEFAELLKSQISTQIIKMMVGERLEIPNAGLSVPLNQQHSPSSSSSFHQSPRPQPMSAALLSQQLGHHFHSHAHQQHSGKNSSREFPIVIRTLRISLVLVQHYHSLLGPHNEVILAFLLELLSMPSTSWEAAVAIEVLHKVLSQPILLNWFCQGEDGPKFVEMIFSRLNNFVRRCLEEAVIDGPNIREEKFGQPGFVYKGAFLPLDESQLSFSKRSILLDWLDKHSAEKIPEAYCLSVSFATLVDATQSVQSAVQQQQQATTEQQQPEQHETNNAANSQTSNFSDRAKNLFQCTYGYLVAGLSTLLDFSMDDSLSEHLLNAISLLTALACKIGSNDAKHATLKTICRATLPHQYYTRFIEANCSPAPPVHSTSLSTSSSLSTAPNGVAGTRSNSSLGFVAPSTAASGDSPPYKEPSTVEPTQVVAMGTVCPSPHLPSQHFNTSVMLTAKNLQVARLLINCVHANSQLLGDCWEMALTTIQHFVWIIGLRPTSTGSFKAGGDTSNTPSAASVIADSGIIASSTNPNTTSTTTAAAANSTTTGASTSMAGAGTVILTTAASSELPDLNQQLNSLFESTTSLDEVSLHHVIAALCKLSNETMSVAQASSRETSFFAIAKLLQTALANLNRLHIFWRPITAHLLELCAHSSANIREWGATSLTQLVKNAMRQTVAMIPANARENGATQATMDEITKRQQLVLNPLSAMSDVDFLDVRAKQLDCLMRILQAESRPMEEPLWPMVIHIVTTVVSPTTAENQISDPQLIDQGFRALSLVVKEFLTVVPFECVEMLIETDALFGQQQFHLNVSLASIGQLWDISDYVRRDSVKQASKEVERVWLVIYTALGRLCVDPRPPVRKSACDTLLQTVAAHGQALDTECWAQMITGILFPMLDRVHHHTQTASTQRSSNTSAVLGAPNILIHHSRDTESKQWAETSVKTLSGVVKIFNAQRPVLLQLVNFADCWAKLLGHIEHTARTDNAEMSLAALKNLQELLFGRQQQTEGTTGPTQPQSHSQPNASTTLAGTGKGVVGSLFTSGGTANVGGLAGRIVSTDLAPSLPGPQWLLAWNCWFNVAHAIVSPVCPATPIGLSLDDNNSCLRETTADIGAAATFMPTISKSYVPGLYHLTTLLEVFHALFHRVWHQIPVDDVRQHRLGQIFQDLAAIPVSPDQIALSIMAQQNPDQLNPAQEWLLACIRAVIQEQMESQTQLRAALPDMLRLLLSFVQFAIHSAPNKFLLKQTTKAAADGKINSNATASGRSPCTQSAAAAESNSLLLVALGEVSLKLLLEFYTKTATFDEVLQQTLLVDIVKNLGEPMALKYRCPSQTTWQLAVTALIKVCQVGLPSARESVSLFKQLWPSFAQSVEGFLFSTSKSPHPLNADERKRHEFMDCLLIELIRTEILPFAGQLPRDFMQRLIDILNRGSINTMDANDVLASDVYQQRTDLSRVCFDALLSLSQADSNQSQQKTQQHHHPVQLQNEGLLRNTSQSSAACSSLGATAIASLLNRCKQLLNDYARDEQNSGHFRLPQERIFGTISALRAITALAEGFSKNPNATLYSHLVTIHPSLVQLIPSTRGDQQIELALMACLNSYQTLLLLNLHNK